jgi:hypothetical protein
MNGDDTTQGGGIKRMSAHIVSGGGTSDIALFIENQSKV